MGKNPYGHKLSKHVEEDGTKFMHAQATICGLWFCTGVCSLMFSLIVLSQLKGSSEALRTNNEEFHGGNVVKITTLMKNSVWHALGGSVVICCIGGVMGALAHNFVDKRNMLGLRLCCVFEGMASCSNFLNGVGYCLLFMWMLGIASSMGNAVTFCEHLSKINITNGSAITALNISAPEGYDCVQWVGHLKPAFHTATIWVCILTICSCKVAAACLGGAKYAKATHDDFEDEELGDD